MGCISGGSGVYAGRAVGFEYRVRVVYIKREVGGYVREAGYTKKRGGVCTKRMVYRKWDVQRLRDGLCTGSGTYMGRGVG